MVAKADIAAARLLTTFGCHIGQLSPVTPSKPYRSPQWPLRRVVENESATPGNADSPPDLPSATSDSAMKDEETVELQHLRPHFIGMELPCPRVQHTRDRNVSFTSCGDPEPAEQIPSQVFRSIAGVSQGNIDPEISQTPVDSSQKGNRAVCSLRRGDTPFVALSKPHMVTARSVLTGAALHPVLNLGWGRPLCEVHCNGLTGFFLGGHDRDLFIKCTGPSHQQLPLVDVSLGGCMMTCSQFEKAAGRELSKKWKESIHVAGEGEGSKATLAAWLRRKADADFGQMVVGRAVWVCWCTTAQHYRAVVFSYSRENGKHKVRYADGMVEELHLPAEQLHFGDVKPENKFSLADFGFSTQHTANGSISAINRSWSAPASTLLAAATSYQAAATAAGVLNRQCSNVSTSSDYHWNDEPHAATVQPDNSPVQQCTPSEQLGAGTPAFLSGGERRGRRSRLASISPQADPPAACPVASDERPVVTTVSRRRRSALPSHVLLLQSASADELRSMTTGLVSCARSCETEGLPRDFPHPTKKRRTGLALQGLQRGASGSCEITDALPNGPHLPSQPKALAALHPADASWQPSTRLGKAHATAVDSTLQQSRQDAASPDLVSAAPLPAAGERETAPATQSRWMSRVAMVLEDQLVLHALQVAAQAAKGPKTSHPRCITANESYHGGSGSCSTIMTSPSASFQALLIKSRLHDGLQSYYEAMLQRFQFFSGRSPQQLSAKMVDFIMATLAGASQAGVVAGSAESEPHSGIRRSGDCCTKEGYSMDGGNGEQTPRR